MQFMYLAVHGKKFAPAVVAGWCSMGGDVELATFGVGVHWYVLGCVQDDASTLHEPLVPQTQTVFVNRDHRQRTLRTWNHEPRTFVNSSQ